MAYHGPITSPHNKTVLPHLHSLHSLIKNPHLFDGNAIMIDHTNLTILRANQISPILVNLKARYEQLLFKLNFPQHNVLFEVPLLQFVVVQAEVGVDGGEVGDRRWRSQGGARCWGLCKVVVDQVVFELVHFTQLLERIVHSLQAFSGPDVDFAALACR